MLSRPPCSLAAVMRIWAAAWSAAAETGCVRQLADQEGGNDFVVEFAGEAVGAEEIEVARERAVALDIGFETQVRADSAGNVVTHGRASGLLDGDLSGAELFFDEGVVGRELRKRAAAETIAAAVADVGEKEVGRRDEAGLGGARGGAAIFDRGRYVEEGDQGGAHAGEIGGVKRLLMDDVVGFENGGVKASLRLDAGRDGGAKAVEEGDGGQMAGDLSCGGPAHAVADHEGTDLGRDSRSVLVVAAVAAGVGEEGVDEIAGGHDGDDDGRKSDSGVNFTRGGRRCQSTRSGDDG